MLHSHLRSQPKCFAYGACHGSVWPNLAAHFGPIVHANVVVHSTVWGSGRWGRYTTTDCCGQCAIYQSIYASILPGDLGSNVSIACAALVYAQEAAARQHICSSDYRRAHTYEYVCVCTQRGAATILPNSGEVQYTGPSITLCCAVLLVRRITNSAGASYGSRKMLALLVSFLDRQLPSLHPLSAVCCHCQHLLHS